MNVRLEDSDATEQLGAALGATLPGRAIVFLHGPLGAGGYDRRLRNLQPPLRRWKRHGLAPRLFLGEQ